MILSNEMTLLNEMTLFDEMTFIHKLIDEMIYSSSLALVNKMSSAF